MNVDTPEKRGISWESIGCGLFIWDPLLFEIGLSVLNGPSSTAKRNAFLSRCCRLIDALNGEIGIKAREAARVENCLAIDKDRIDRARLRIVDEVRDRIVEQGPWPVHAMNDDISSFAD